MAVRNNHENPMPVIDEGWWASVLAEEGRYMSYSAPRPVAAESKPAAQAKPASKAEEEECGAVGPAANWEQVKEMYMRDQIVSLSVTGYNRGGLLVEGNGLYGFVPFSHLVGVSESGDKREVDLASYVGRSLSLKVIECIPEEERVVFSERAAQSGPGKRAELFNSLRPGQKVKGAVTNITDFGVFVDLGGVEGLIHISELSWGRVSHPSQIVKVGGVVEVQVLDLAPERCRVALSLKRLQPNPWQNAAVDFPPGCVKPAVITSVLSFGAFARLEAGVEGLIHASEIPSAGGKPLKEVLSVGQSVMVRVLHLDPAHQRMGLSMRL
ncbi:MAG: S1 RNA-binding domain-containing protein [Chloroflexi bacterium]|nr:S1 RNA-binding domain-containing protein [Chloroflexota bacterium]MCA2000415.1 S1 RNA-binding domain-containing protein [Chloroflexota bacterium]